MEFFLLFAAIVIVITMLCMVNNFVHCIIDEQYVLAILALLVCGFGFLMLIECYNCLEEEINNNQQKNLEKMEIFDDNMSADEQKAFINENIDKASDSVLIQEIFDRALIFDIISDVHTSSDVLIQELESRGYKVE